MVYVDNCILNYREEIVCCQWCDGTGKQTATRIELMNYLLRIFLFRIERGEKIFRDAMAIAREWQETYKIPCDKCEGEGSWTERW